MQSPPLKAQPFSAPVVSTRSKPNLIRPRWALLPLLGLAGLLAPTAYAEGFRNPPPGAFGLGRAGGRIAQVDDSSAVTHNPANLMDLKAMEFSLAPTFVYVGANYLSPAGVPANTQEPWKILPNFFAVLPLKNDRFMLGLGVTTPYGLSTDWALTGSFADPAATSLRYNAPYFTELKTINLNPALAVRLCDHVTAAVGLDVFWSELTFKQYLSPLIPDLVGRAKGDGFGFGGNAGVTWQITGRQRLAATFRSPVDVNYEGNFDLNSTLAAVNSRSSFNSKIKFPTIVALGYGLQVTDTVRLEADVEWLQFSRFNTLPVNVGANPLAIPSSTINESWKDTLTIGIGGDWKFTPGWVLRAGYQYYQSPVPDTTFSPSIPDSDQHALTAGLGYKHNRHALEMAYGLILYKDRNITTDQTASLNGKYTFNVHLLSLSYRYSF